MVVLMYTDNILCGVPTLRHFRIVRSEVLCVEPDSWQDEDTAKIPCESAKGAVLHHVVDINKMIPAAVQMEAAS